MLNQATEDELHDFARELVVVARRWRTRLDERLKVLYKGRATPMYVHGFYPDLAGWDPTWEKRFPELYGYDVPAAKRLLAEAGYPNGFKAKA